MFIVRNGLYKVFVSILLVSLILSAVAVPSPAQAQQGDGIQRDVNAETGVVSRITGGGGEPIVLSGAMSADMTSEERSNVLVNRFAPEFGLTNPEEQLTLSKESLPSFDRVVSRYQQVYNGIPVFAGELIVNASEGGALHSMSGEVSQNLALDTNPSINAESAVATALQGVAKWYGGTVADYQASEPTLTVLDEKLIRPSNRPALLTWVFDVSPVNGSQPVREKIFVDAQIGRIVLHYNQVDTAWHGAGNGSTISSASSSANASTGNSLVLGSPSVSTYTANGTETLPGTFVCNQGTPACTSGADAHADAAHTHALGTYDLYATKHLRDSLNGSGMTIISTVHYGSGYDNAFWDGSQMGYGDGYGFAMADDVVGHELTHGVTEHESNLIYLYQSGAINESFSDVWGEYYDQTNGLGNDTPAVKWLMGEDVTDLGAIRNMMNPPAFGDPDSMTSGLYYKGEGDNGGVHINSGVNNKAVYLMVDGGTFNAIKVVGIGWDKTAAIYYEVQTNLLGSGSNYSDLYYAVQQACATLTGGALGITVGDCVNVKAALDAVKMNTPVSVKFLVTAPMCPAGMTPSSTPLFQDNFEGSLATKWSATSRWSLVTDIANSPTHAVYGDDLAALLDERSEMNAGVLLPANAYLHFSHAYDFEFAGSAYYDGGVVEYSTNGGASWVDAGSLFSAGANYGGTIASGFSNALSGRKGFVGTSYPYYFDPVNLVSTRLNLSTLSGQTVRFRFRFGTDNFDPFYNLNGWHIDDVKIYTCLGNPTVPTLTSPANNALVTNYSSLLLNWADSTSGIDHYHVQVASDAAFTSLVHDQDSLLTSEYLINTGLIENKQYYWRVRSFNSENVTNGWSLVRNFRTVLTPPVLVSPLDASAELTARPLFLWSNINLGVSPTGYTIQISKNSGFTMIVHTGNPVISEYTPTVNLPAGTLYWRVLAKGVNGPSAYSSPVRSIVISATPPPAPSLTLPANGILTTNYTPTFTWTIGALPVSTTVDHYQIQVDNNADFSSPEINQDTPDATPSFTPIVPFDSNTKFYWRVRTFNNLGEYSPWSVVRNFRTALLSPALNSPVDTTTISELRPVFDWDDVAGATGYTIQISKNSTFTMLAHTGNPVGSQYVPTVDLPKNMTLYWRVLTKGLNGPSAYSGFRSFTTPLDVPKTPTLTLPANNALTTDYTPTLTWTIVTPPAVDHFIVQVDNNADFSSPEVNDIGVASSPFETPALAENTKFYWRVRAVDASGGLSNWSVVRYFRTALLPTTLTSPADVSTVDVLRPILDWSDVTGATGYTIQTSRFPSFAPLLATYQSVGSTFTPTSDLPKNTDIYWRVLTKGLNGPSAPSGAFMFHTPTNPPSTPTLLLPASNALTTDYTPTFTWSISVTSPAWDQFQIQVDNNADFSSPEINSVTLSSPFTDAIDLASNTKFYWRVRAMNTGTNENSNWSTAGRFFRTAITPPVLVTPIDGAFLSSWWPVFNWDDVPGATGYTIQISRNVGFTSLVSTTNTVSSFYQPFNYLPVGQTLYWRVKANGANGPSAWSPIYSMTTPVP